MNFVEKYENAILAKPYLIYCLFSALQDCSQWKDNSFIYYTVIDS